MKKAYVLLADGFETIEALTPVDVLRRCAIEVQTAAIGESKRVVSSHNVAVEADMLISDNDLSDGDAIILPGGYPGYVNLANSIKVGELVQKYYSEGKIVAAICGAPIVLAKYDVAKGSMITCHTSVKEQMSEYKYVSLPTVRDDNLITGKGAGVSVEFSLLIAELLTDKSVADTVRHKMELD